MLAFTWEDGGSNEPDPFSANGGQIRFLPNWFKLTPMGRLREKLFVKVPDTHIWLSNPRPPGFLRWEGPIVLPNDPMIRVDLVSDHAGGPAQPGR